MTEDNEWSILIDTSGKSNKFWMVRYNTATNNVESRWGRLGTNGQSKTESGSRSYADTLYYNKRTKRSAQYRECSKEQYERLQACCKALGTSNKMTNIRWVDIADGMARVVTVEELAHPKVTPGIMATIEIKGTKKRKGSISEVILASEGLMTNTPYGVVAVDDNHPLFDLSEKIYAAISAGLEQI